MKFLIFCGVVATILILCAGCETPAPKPDPFAGPPPVEGINEVCNECDCEEMHK